MKNLGTEGDHLQKALQYTLHSDQYYSALNKQDTRGNAIEFYDCANTQIHSKWYETNLRKNAK